MITNNFINKSEDVINSLRYKNKLNPKLWEKMGGKFTLKEEIRSNLEEIAMQYYFFLKLKWIPIKDIIITGSSSGYNWSDFSDVDIHIIMDTSKISDNKDVNEEFLRLKKEKFNKQHKISIKGYNVELYVQGINEDLAVDAPIFSIRDNEWIKKPVSEYDEIRLDLISKSVDAYMYFYEKRIIKNLDLGNQEIVIKYINALKDNIKEMRKYSLNNYGDKSIGNLTFKVLRRLEFIDKLDELKNKAFDTLYSI